MTQANPVEQLQAQLYDIFSLTSVTVGKQPPDVITFRGRLLLDSEDAYRRLRPRFESLQYTPAFRREQAQDVIIALPGVAQIGESNRWINLVLFLLTVASTLFVGGSTLSGFDWTQGILYSATIMLILGAHELGHYFTARYYGEAATLPYFIPMPFSLGGTMGAFIRLKAPHVTRRSIFDVGLAGPLAGLVFAVPLLFIGLAMSDVKSFAEIRTLYPAGSTFQEGNSILYAIAKYAVFGKWLPSAIEDVWLSPVASAAWLGLLVTALNLLPASQLDGGHVAYALLGARARQLSRLMVIAMIVLAAALFYFRLPFENWIIWGLLIAFIGVSHPPPLNTIAPLDAKRKIVGVLSWLLFILIFTPIPVTPT